MYVLDTDVAVDLLRGDEDTVAQILPLGRVYTTLITIAELSYGMHKSADLAKHRKKLLNFIRGVRLLGLDLASCGEFGMLKARLSKSGKRIENFDLLIACICLTNNCRLITRNKKHYENIPGLKIYDI
jgi:predicted nucleic acid-binding protein